MRTLGVDLASQPKKTAACIIEWEPGSARVTDLRLNLTNRDIITLAEGCGPIGIDSPFGWPLPFVDFLNQAHAPDREATRLDTTRADYLRPLRFRRTDLRVWNEYKLLPLSVSSDKLAMPAMRCVELLDLLKVSDRSGDGVWEVYPAVALKVWGFAFKGFKPLRIDPVHGNPALATLLQTVREACPWLDLGEAEQCCSRNHDAFDALIASLVTRAAFRGLTERPPADEAEIAKREGWIAVPEPASLAKLAEPRST